MTYLARGPLAPCPDWCGVRWHDHGAPDRTRDTFEPWDLLTASIAIRYLHWGSLPRDMYAYADIRRREIFILRDLTEFEARCTLTHELIHIERGHILEGRADLPTSGKEALVAEEENLVERLAAERLVDPADLRGLADRIHLDGDEATANRLRIDLITLDKALELASELVSA